MKLNPTTVTQCKTYIELLTEALEILAERKVQISAHGRLQQALKYLRVAVTTGEFPGGGEDRSRLLAAMRDAAEWWFIATRLGEKVSGEFLDDLNRAMRGPLALIHEVGEPFQLQSQFFFGAMLAEKISNVGVPEEKGWPDFVIRDGTLAHGIEIKAPTSAKGLEKLIRYANIQLGRLSGGGLVVLDVSALVGQPLSAPDAPLHASPAVAEAAINAQMTLLKPRVRSLVLRKTWWHRGKGVTASVVITRMHHWYVDGDYAVPASALALAWRRYYRTKGSLAYWRATELGNRVGDSLAALVPDLRVKWED